MKRREFITLLGSAAAWPLAARAQQGERTRRIGVLLAYTKTDPEAQVFVRTFVDALAKIGWVEGRSIYAGRQAMWNACAVWQKS